MIRILAAIALFLMANGWFCFCLAEPSSKSSHFANYPLCTLGFPKTPEEMRRETKDGLSLIRLYMFPGWYKPFCSTKYFEGSNAILVKITDDGRAIINPQTETNQPPVIHLQDLTVKDAENVWGQGRITKDVVTFDLMTAHSAPYYETDVYHLDTKVIDGRFSLVRLRGIRITKPEWTKVL